MGQPHGHTVGRDRMDRRSGRAYGKYPVNSLTPHSSYCQYINLEITQALTHGLSYYCALVFNFCMLVNIACINDFSSQQYYRFVEGDEYVLIFLVSLAFIIKLAFQYKYIDCTNFFLVYLLRAFQ